jgi:hypothetical protein
MGSFATVGCVALLEIRDFREAAAEKICRPDSLRVIGPIALHRQVAPLYPQIGGRGVRGRGLQTGPDARAQLRTLVYMAFPVILAYGVQRQANKRPGIRGFGPPPRAATGRRTGANLSETERRERAWNLCRKPTI